ncbi:MAG TPA: DUF3662 domain-containing protein [Firmicutes bacterium]|nr:DUF3662 domain-containing protein [Bacillota bacterium]
MSLISRLEGWLEHGIEGLFRRRTGPVQPVEVGRRLWRLMEEQKQVSVSRVYVPNAFRVCLAPSDYARLAGIVPRLSEELSAHLEQLARRQGYSLVGPLRIAWEEADVPPGVFRAEAAFLRSEAKEPGEDTVVFRRPASPRGWAAREGDGLVRAEGPLFVVREGPDRGRSLRLRPGENRIGRADDNDLVLGDTNVSRHHASLLWRDGVVRVRDLGSRNGTRLNGQPVEEAEVAEGDEVQLGLDVLVWGEGSG